jgi:hypothetical protein
MNQLDLTPTFEGTHLPTGGHVNHIPVNAFNLQPGVTFITDEMTTTGFAVWVTMSVARAPHSERVFVWARRADEVTETPGDSVDNRTFDFDYCTPVGVVGNVVNWMDPDDNDWGN